MGKTVVVLVFVLIGYAAAAPWKCFKTSDGSTVCFSEPSAPCFNPPCISIPQPCPPCTGPATIATPPCPCPPPPCSCPPPPCPCPPAPCPCPPLPCPCPLPPCPYLQPW